MKRVLTKEGEARVCLASGSFLINPAWMTDSAKEEEKLKARCKVCWHLREWFPSWVSEYVKKWSLEKKTKEKSDDPV